jgi:hypothetical protein
MVLYPVSPTDNPVPLSAPTRGLLRLRGARCHTWHELVGAGLSFGQTLVCVAELVQAGRYRLQLGPLLVSLEDEG